MQERKNNFSCTRTAQLKNLVRGVAQPGSALAWGASGRWFESSHPDKSSGRHALGVITPSKYSPLKKGALLFQGLIPSNRNDLDYVPQTLNPILLSLRSN